MPSPRASRPPEGLSAAERTFYREVTRLLRQARARSAAGGRDARSALLQFRRQVLSDMATVRVSDDQAWAIDQLGRLQSVLLTASDELRLRLDPLTRLLVEEMWQLGADMAPKSAARIGLRPPWTALDEQILLLSRDYSASLVHAMTDRTQAQLDGILTRSILGRVQVPDALAQLEAVLDVPARPKERYGSLEYQALRVLETEAMRVWNLANTNRILQLADFVPGLQKKWLHATFPREPRAGHVALHGRSLPVEQDFVIVNKRGQVMHAYGPHDPSLPASETVFCGCILVPVLPGWSDYDDGASESPEGSRARQIAAWIQGNRQDLLDTESGRNWLRQHQPGLLSELGLQDAP